MKDPIVVPLSGYDRHDRRQPVRIPICAAGESRPLEGAREPSGWRAGKPSGTYSFDRTADSRQRVLHRHAAADGERLAARRPRLLLHAHRHPRALSIACAAAPCSTRWGGTTTACPTERRVQNYFGVRCDPSLPYDPSFVPPEKPGKQADLGLAAELHRAVRAADGRRREGLRGAVEIPRAVGRLGG